MQAGTIHKLIALFDEAFRQLDASVDLKTLEELAVVVHKAMTVQARNYHNLEHVFNLVDPTHPIQTLAALFHDIVYYQVDQGFLPEISKVISPYIRSRQDGLYIAKPIGSEERQVWMAMELFAMREGNRLHPAGGLNEFLSALVMNHKLSKIVTEVDLLKMTLCVEATIPFRGVTEDGKSHFDRLEERLERIRQRWGIVLTKAEIEEAVRLAVVFANKDVDGFAEVDAGRFLENTWKLLPELNVALRSREVYSVREYRQAIQNMEAFLSTLNPANVFHSFRGVPAEPVHAQMVQCARQNIETARHYLRIKLLAQAILEALAEASGGDAPLSLFMGDLPREGEQVQRLEQLLPEVEVPGWLDPASTIYTLLASGRESSASFDLRTAPLTLFLYKRLRPEEQERSLERAREMFAGRLSAQDFLASLDRGVVSAIAKASAAMALTRGKLLLRFLS